MLVKVFGSAVIGVDALTISIECDKAPGSGYFIVGLPDNAVKESIERVLASLKNNLYDRPRQKIVINMAPADLKKEGAAYDLAIAIGMLATTEQISAERLGDFVIMGELALDGTLRPIKGALPMAIQAREEKFKGLIVPAENAREAGLVNNLDVYGCHNLKEVVDLLEGRGDQKPIKVDTREEFFAA
ncbi:MAG TPA: magnesium chelatase domain-containing protein, partial [Chitinophagaceae bacterium]|nr:magnesium chelatase domain-containing protein [Chitinophagaceae bacterium]